MRTHGWGGSPPRDTDEARERILLAARDKMTRAGATTTAEVADHLGVTRQTVYRYFATTDELLNAAAVHAVSELEVELVAHVQQHLAETGGDAGDAAVEVVAFVYEHLREDPVLSRLLAPGRISLTLEGLTAPSSIAVGRRLLDSFPVDWLGAGLGVELQRELVEHLLRTLQSLVLDPGDPPRSPSELRAYLHRWLAPVVMRRAPRPSGAPTPG